MNKTYIQQRNCFNDDTHTHTLAVLAILKCYKSKNKGDFSLNGTSFLTFLQDTL